MLSQKFQGKDARTRRRKEKLLNIFAPLRLCVFAFLLFFISCQSKPTDLRTLAPSETLIYLETSDLSKTLDALTESRAFQEAAKSKPDFSALGNVQFAIAVTGFEASEKKVTEENSILNFKPRFVAVADTHAWNWQTLSLTENQIGNFVKETYGDETSLEKSDKNGGKWFAWTAKDESRVFAFVEGSQIFFGNDAAAIEKCLAVKRGEADNLLKNEALSRAYAANSANNLAFGYVSPEGVAQISNLAGVLAASEASEEAEGQSFIARVLPQILQNSVREISWTATKTEKGIEDKYSISLTTETAAVVKETLVPAAQTQSKMIAFIPPEAFSVTRYNLQNPQIAWRSLLLVAGKNADAMSAKILIAFSGNLLEPYGITDAETFLSAVDSKMWTVNFDAEGEKSIVAASYKSDAELEKIKKSVAGIDFKKPSQTMATGWFWTSEDKEITFLLTATFSGEKILILGDSESVKKSIEANYSYLTKEANPMNRRFYDKFAENNNSVALTYGRDSIEKTIDVLGERKTENMQMLAVYTTETRFNAQGIERKTVSDFGLIGTILEQFEE
jgi:hypothetical protein